MKKKLLLVTLASCLTLSLFGCGKDPVKEDDVVTDDKADIAVVLKTLSSEYWQYVKSGADAAAKELDINLQVLGPNSESDIEGQVAIIEDVIAQKVDAICVAPNQPDAVVSSLEKAKEAGIHVFFIDTDAEFEGKTAFFGPGNEAAAALGGKHIGELVDDGGKAVIIRGRLGDVVHDQREDGFTKELTAAGIEVIDVQPGDSASDKAMAVMEDFLQKYDDIDAVLTTNDEMAQGAARAIEQAGIEGIEIIGFGGSDFILDPIKDGSVEATISINPYDMGKVAVENMVKVVNGEQIEAFVDTGASLITADLADEYRANLKAILEN